MDSGQRDRYVTIQQEIESIGTSGFPINTWIDLAIVWMQKDDISGQERFRSAQATAPFSTTWTMPYRADMDPELVDVAKTRRLVYQGRRYDVQFARQTGRREEIELMTLAGGTA